MVSFDNQVFLKNRRSKTEIWKKEDIEKHFNLAELKTGLDNTTGKSFTYYDNYFNFVLSPTSRFSPTVEEKLNEYPDVLYFKLFGIDRDTDDVFIRYINCGFVTVKRDSFRIFKL